jgi:release factor glutamine methyltransferase
MKTIREVLPLSIEYLKQKGINSARREAQLLLSSIIGISPLELYTQFDKPLIDKEITQFREAIKRRGLGEPWQYIIGSVEFFGCSFQINRSVLIPRQETEILVDKIFKNLPSKPLVIWDICTGSGCIGISLKKKRADCTIVLSDIEEAALGIAKKNAKTNQVDVDFVLGDLLKPFGGRKADVIICNPPYVSMKEYLLLDPEVRDWEPKEALLGGSTGLEFYQKIAQSLRSHLNPGGMAYFEIGHQMGNQMREIFYDFNRFELLKDWSSHNRYYKVEIE